LGQLREATERFLFNTYLKPLYYLTKQSFLFLFVKLHFRLRAVHQFVTFAVATPFQHAVATGLAAPDAYYAELRDDYRRRRDRLCEGLEAAGFEVRRPEGTYFALADVRPLGFADGREFCLSLVERVGVAAIPVSAFAGDARLRHLVRFAFCKDDATLDEALRRLRGLKA